MRDIFEELRKTIRDFDDFEWFEVQDLGQMQYRAEGRSLQISDQRDVTLGLPIYHFLQSSSPKHFEEPILLTKACDDTVYIMERGDEILVKSTNRVPLYIKETPNISISDDGLEVVVKYEAIGIIRKKDGYIVIIVNTKDQRQWQEARQKIKIEPLSLPAVDLNSVVSVLRNKWLQEILKRYEIGDWNRIIGMGLILRYWWTDLPKDIKDQEIKNLIKGGEPLEIKTIKEIIQSFSSNHIKSIKDFLKSQISLLHIDIEIIFQQYRPQDEDLQAFLDVCYRRDDIEGIREILYIAGSQDPDIDDLIADLDREAWAYVVTIPPGLAKLDDRLLKTLRREVDVWWTWPVRESEEFKLW